MLRIIPNKIHITRPFRLPIIRPFHIDNSCVLCLLPEIGSKWLDCSRYRNNGTISGAILKQGRYGPALQLDGVDDYVDCGNDASLKPTKVVTMEFWANPSSYSDVTLGCCLGFAIQKGYSFWQWANNGVPQSWFMELNRIGGTRRYIQIHINQIPLNTYTHIVTIFDAENGKITVYKNGAFFNKKNVLTGDIVYSGNFLIGDKFKGIFDEVRIYNRALSAEEIKNLYFAGKPN